MKIIGFSQEMVERKTAERVRVIEAKNLEVKKHNTLMHLIALAVGLLTPIIIFCVFRFVDVITIQILATGFLLMGAGATIAIIEFACRWTKKEFREDDIKSLHYARIIRENNILDMTLSDNRSYPVLKLTFENKKTHVVDEDVICFKSQMRTDVDEITIDMENDIVLFPYKKEEDT